MLQWNSLISDAPWADKGLIWQRTRYGNALWRNVFPSSFSLHSKWTCAAPLGPFKREQWEEASSKMLFTDILKHQLTSAKAKSSSAKIFRMVLIIQNETVEQVKDLFSLRNPPEFQCNSNTQEKLLEQMSRNWWDTRKITGIAKLLCPNSLTHSLFPNAFQREQSSALYLVHSRMECFKHHSQRWVSNFVKFLIHTTHSVVIYLLTYVIND